MSNLGENEPINLLSLDGGGVRGVSTLVMLDLVMRRIQEKEGLEELPKPCDYFDLIAGTSTGGLIAIMLGRLQMTTEEALAEYENVAGDIFNWTNRKFHMSTKFRSRALTKAVQNLVVQRGESDLMRNPDPSQTKGKAFVCAMPAKEQGLPRLFRTYNLEGQPHDWHNDCKIWEAARATTAAPTYFKPMTIERGETSESFIDAAMGCNNPTDVLLKEAARVFDKNRKLGCVLSLGTGTRSRNLASPKEVGQLLYFMRVAKTLKDIAVDTELVHRNMEDKFEHFARTYFRFNVPGGAENIGLADWTKMAELNAATETYLTREEIDADINNVVDILLRKSTTHITIGHVCAPHEEQIVLDSRRAQPMGSASHNFTGRKDLLAKLKTHFAARESTLRERRHFLLHGMGGVGKTQIALKYAEMEEERFKHICWIDATDLVTAEQSFKTFGLGHMPNEDERSISMAKVQKWISLLDEEWLLILDNCSNGDVRRFLPPGRKGNIIYTSRDDNLSLSLSEDAIARVDEMRLEEAKSLLVLAARRAPSGPDEWDEVEVIAKELGCLPLAIDQAGAYICVMGNNFRQYLEIFLDQKDFLLGQARFKADDPTKLSVYATFDISYKALQMMARDSSGNFDRESARGAIKILNLICFYHNERIPHEMVCRASEYRQAADDRNICPLDEGFSSLGDLVATNASGAWKSRNYLLGVQLLENMSLIKQDKVAEHVSMHVLIHSWARDRMKKLEGDRNARVARSVMYHAMTSGQHQQEIRFRRELLPHAIATWNSMNVKFSSDVFESEYEYKMGYLAQDTEVHTVAEESYARAIDIAKWEGFDTELVLKPKTQLAKLYYQLARFDEAETLLLEITDRRRHTLGAAHLKTIASRASLVQIYFSTARYKACKQQLEQSLKLLKERYADNTNHKLIKAYLNALNLVQDNLSLEDGMRFTQAVCSNTFSAADPQKREEELERSISKNGVDHSTTRKAKIELAKAYEEVGEFSKAEKLHLEIHQYHMDLYGEDDQRTLGTSGQLASLFLEQNRFIDAEIVLRKTLRTAQLKLGPRHPDTLQYLYQMFITLGCQVRTVEAFTLGRIFVDIQKELFGPTHQAVIIASQILDQLKGAGMARPEFKENMWRNCIERHREARIALGLPVILGEAHAKPWSIDYRALNFKVPRGADENSYPEMVYVATEQGRLAYAAAEEIFGLDKTTLEPLTLTNMAE